MSKRYVDYVDYSMKKKLDNHITYYPTPISLSYAWGFGSLAGICLLIQLATGLFLAMHYTPDVNSAFSSVEHIMRDVNYGWFVRYSHATGASCFFIVLYLHIGRGLFYRSYCFPRHKVWYSGIILYVLVMAIAFLGYVLPWGQMSFWGATVITNLFSAIPMVGPTIANWLWGGYAVDNPTLVRFFALHFCLPFIVAAFSLLHIVLLHEAGSNNPSGRKIFDGTKFYPNFVWKDLLGLSFFYFVFVYLVFFDPNLLGHPDNYIKANPLSTPTHIVPEWYFLPWYAILRAIPHKLFGVIAMGAGIAILAFLPKVDTSLNRRSSTFKPLLYITYWALIVTFIGLGWLGGQEIIGSYVTYCRLLVVYYFTYFLFLMPFLYSFENNNNF